MGSDLYLSVDVHYPDWRDEPYEYAPLFTRRSTFLARGIVVDAFDVMDERTPENGYLADDEFTKMQKRRDCPWRDAEPYWVRKIDGAEFVAIVREKRWQRIQKAPDGSFDFADQECSPELRAYAAMVESLLADGCGVRVWCWHSQ